MALKQGCDILELKPRAAQDRHRDWTFQTLGKEEANHEGNRRASQCKRFALNKKVVRNIRYLCRIQFMGSLPLEKRA